MDNLKIYYKAPKKYETRILKDICKTFTYFLRDIKNVFSLNSCNSLNLISILISFLFLKEIDPAKLYHFIRVQSLMKLYVLFGFLDVCDKLVSTVIFDIKVAIKECASKLKKKNECGFKFNKMNECFNKFQRTTKSCIQNNNENCITNQNNVSIYMQNNSEHENCITNQNNSSNCIQNNNRHENCIQNNNRHENCIQNNNEHENYIENNNNIENNNEHDSCIQNNSKSNVELEKENILNSSVIHDKAINNTEIKNQSSINCKMNQQGNNHILLIFLSFLLISFTMLHTMILYIYYITLHVTANSQVNVLYTLLLSVNFVELRTVLFKKHNHEAMKSLYEYDVMKRFYTILYLIIILIFNIKENCDNTLLELLFPIGLIYSSKIFVEWLKHIFVWRFNDIMDYEYLRYVHKENTSNVILMMCIMWKILGFKLFMKLFVLFA